jgi:hypothetical protein
MGGFGFRGGFAVGTSTQHRGQQTDKHEPETKQIEVQNRHAQPESKLIKQGKQWVIDGKQSDQQQDN